MSDIPFVGTLSFSYIVQKLKLVFSRKEDSVFFVKGTQTTTTATWTGSLQEISSLYDGLTINYWVPQTSSSNATLNLTLSGGITTGAKNCYSYSSTRFYSYVPKGTFLKLTYRVGVIIDGISYTGWWTDAPSSKYKSVVCGSPYQTSNDDANTAYGDAVFLNIVQTDGASSTVVSSHELCGNGITISSSTDGTLEFSIE